MKEIWKEIEEFPNYSVSNFGRVRSNFSERILSVYANQSGLVQVGLMLNGIQKHRSVPLLVARAFIPQPSGPFDTPINLDGDRYNNHVDNLMWRPRWFAIKFNKQFKEEVSYENQINVPIEDLKSGEVTDNSLECAKRYGLLEQEIVLAILNNTYVWPTYQKFRVVER
jgi:hypothetical protein